MLTVVIGTSAFCTKIFLLRALNESFLDSALGKQQFDWSIFTEIFQLGIFTETFQLKHCGIFNRALLIRT